MSVIKLDLSTEKETGDIAVKAKFECSRNELYTATAYLMSCLAAEVGLEQVQDIVNKFRESSDGK